VEGNELNHEPRRAPILFDTLVLAAVITALATVPAAVIVAIFGH
jgi:hypothetical protein